MLIQVYICLERRWNSAYCCASIFAKWEGKESERGWLLE